MYINTLFYYLYTYLRKELAILFATTKMTKRHLLLTLLLAFTITSPIHASTLPVLLENNTTFVPLRFLSQTLGYSVTFTNDKEPIVVSDGQSILKFRIGSNRLEINGKTVTLPLTIKKINGTTLVPLRVFSENLGTTTLFEDNVLYLSNGSYYWIWEIDNGKNVIKSLLPQKFFPSNTLSIYNQNTLDRLLSFSPVELKQAFPGALKIPGTSNYIAYINPNTPDESTLTFHYDFSKGNKPYCITLGQSPQSTVDILGFNYRDGFTPSDVITKLGTPLSTYTLSSTSVSYLFKVGSHYLNFTFAQNSTANSKPTLYYIDLYASTYFYE